MKYYLLLDSSNTSLTVGLANEEKLIDFISYEAWQTQSEHMIPELDELLDKYNVAREDIGGVMVSIGPGSYTGVRIAITISKVIGLALEVPVYPVSALQILKCHEKPSICLINARSNRSYIGVYENENCLLQDCIMTNDEAKEYISAHPNYVVCGETKYLGINGYESDIAQEMFMLIGKVEPCPDSRALKPVYLKD